MVNPPFTLATRQNAGVTGKSLIPHYQQDRGSVSQCPAGALAVAVLMRVAEVVAEFPAASVALAEPQSACMPPEK
jgi:hypothetical protein